MGRTDWPGGLGVLLAIAGCAPAPPATGEPTVTFTGNPALGGYELNVGWQPETVVAWAASAYVVMYTGNDGGIFPRTSAVGTVDIRVATPKGVAADRTSVSVTPRSGQHDVLVVGIDPDVTARIGKLATGVYSLTLYRKAPSLVGTPSVVTIDGKSIQSVLLGE